MDYIALDLLVIERPEMFEVWLEWALFGPLLLSLSHHADFDAYCLKEGRP